jgi:hypothetical protein
LRISGNTVGIPQETLGSKVFIGNPNDPLNYIPPPGKKNQGQLEDRKEDGEVNKINGSHNEAGQGMEDTEPVIEETIGRITVQSPPKDAGANPRPVNYPKKGNLGYPRQEGNTFFNN